MPLGLEIKDIIFSYKNYAADVPETLSNQVEDKPVQLSKQEIQSVQISSEVEDKIKSNVEKIKFLNDEQKEKFASKIVSTYKAKNLQE